MINMKKIALFLAMVIALSSFDALSATPKRKAVRKPAAAATAAAEPAVTTLPAGFNISTIVSLNTEGDESYFNFNEKVARDLTSAGFKFTGKTREKISFSTDEPELVPIPAKIYSLGGIRVTVAADGGYVHRVTVKFPNRETLNQFIESAGKLGFKKNYTDRNSAYYNPENSSLTMIVKGMKVTIEEIP